MNENQEIIKPPAGLSKEKEQQISAAAARAIEIRDKSRSFLVQDEKTYQTASNGLKKIKEMSKVISELIGPFVRDTYDSWKKAKARENTIMKPLGDAKEHLDGQIRRFLLKKEEERREKEEKERRDREEAMKKALEAENAGNHAEAEVIIEQAAIAESTPTITEAAPSGGPVIMKKWKARITNPRLLPREYLIPNEALINSIARGLKGNDPERPEIPGVEFYQDIIPSSRF